MPPPPPPPTLDPLLNQRGLETGAALSFPPLPSPPHAHPWPRHMAVHPNLQVIPFDSLFWFSEVGLVPQFPIFPAHMTVEQYLFTSCRTVVRASVQAMANRVQDAMQLCGLGDIAARRCAVLSGGQTKKVRP